MNKMSIVIFTDLQQNNIVVVLAIMFDALIWQVTHYQACRHAAVEAEPQQYLDCSRTGGGE
jgi:hypothetical protein